MPPTGTPTRAACFLGLTTSTEPRHIALAVLEGVAFSARLLLGACENAAGLRADEVRLSGGGARSPVWNQVKASVHGRSLAILETLDSGVLGAALLGMVAAGIEDDLDALAERRVRVTEEVDPEPDDRARMDDLYAAYQAAYEALVPVFPKVSAAGAHHDVG